MPDSSSRVHCRLALFWWFLPESAAPGLVADRSRAQSHWHWKWSIIRVQYNKHVSFSKTKKKLTPASDPASPKMTHDPRVRFFIYKPIIRQIYVVIWIWYIENNAQLFRTINRTLESVFKMLKSLRGNRFRKLNFGGRRRICRVAGWEELHWTRAVARSVCFSTSRLSTWNAILWIAMFFRRFLLVLYQKLKKKKKLI